MICIHAVSLSLVLIVGGCATVHREPTDQYSDRQLQEMGRRFLAAHDLGQALKYFTLAEKRRPNDAEIQYELGLAFYERGIRSDAFLHMKKALELKPDYPEVENALGRFYADQDQLDLAQRSFERATANRFYSTPHLAFFNLGLIYEKKGNPEVALRQYQEAVRLQPNYGLAYFRMGQLLEEAGRKDEAREGYAKVIEFAPDTAEAYYRYGVLCYDAGEYRVAARSFNRVLQLAPYSTMAEDSGKYIELLEEAASARMLTYSPPPGQRGEASQLDLISSWDLQDKQLAIQLPPTAETSDADRERVQEPGTGTRVDTSMLGPSAGEEEEKPQIEMPPTPTSTNIPSDTPPVLPENVRLDQPETELPRYYIVRVASFRDKQDAEKLQRWLVRKGFEVSIKPIGPQGVGRLYAVQLKPVDSAELADRMLMQVKKLRRGKMKIIEEPVR
jgi:type IV pilus assembly protein PilF